MFSKTKIVSLIAASVLNGICFSSALAEEVTIVTQDFPSKTEKWGENEIGGIGGEMITKALKAEHISFKVFWMPWKRAQEDIQLNKDKKTFILPLTRNKEREKKYIWVSKLYNADTIFVTYKGVPVINSLNQARGKKIGVLLSTSYELFLLNEKNKMDKNDIKSAPNDAFNVKSLQDHSIDAWYTGLIGTYALLREEKADISNFNFGKKIDSEENYLATTTSTSPELVSRVRNAIEKFKKTQQYDSIIKKYTGKK